MPQSYKIAAGFTAAAAGLVLLILLHGPVPEDYAAAEAQSVTESDN